MWTLKTTTKIILIAMENKKMLKKQTNIKHLIFQYNVWIGNIGTEGTT